MISFGDSDGDNSDGDNSDGESSYLGAYRTPKSIEEQIVGTKQSILYLALGLDFSVTSKLSSEKKDSLIKAYMTERNIQFDPNDLTKLNELREKLIQEEKEKKEKKGGKRRKSKKYRKSRKQRKTKTKRRVRRSYKYKYK